jgi:hypothetical protein
VYVSDDHDDDRRPADVVPLFPDPPPDNELLALIRRYERFAVDVDQRLKDIVMLLRVDRERIAEDRERIDQLERDFVDHRAVVADLTKKRKARK